MATTKPPVSPIVLKDVDVIIHTSATDGKNFAAHCDSVTLTPSSSAVSWAGMAKNTHTDQSAATWATGLSYAQDWGPDSLSTFLFDHEGEEFKMTFAPRTGALPKVEAQIVITPGAIGGGVNAFATASVTLGVNGRPTIVRA